MAGDCERRRGDSGKQRAVEKIRRTKEGRRLRERGYPEVKGCWKGNEREARAVKARGSQKDRGVEKRRRTKEGRRIVIVF